LSRGTAARPRLVDLYSGRSGKEEEPTRNSKDMPGARVSPLCSLPGGAVSRPSLAAISLHRFVNVASRRSLPGQLRLSAQVKKRCAFGEWTWDPAKYKYVFVAEAPHHGNAQRMARARRRSRRSCDCDTHGRRSGRLQAALRRASVPTHPPTTCRRSSAQCQCAHTVCNSYCAPQVEPEEFTLGTKVRVTRDAELLKKECTSVGLNYGGFNWAIWAPGRSTGGLGAPGGRTPAQACAQGALE